jgi:hypothetical protein
MMDYIKSAISFPHSVTFFPRAQEEETRMTREERMTRIKSYFASSLWIYLITSVQECKRDQRGDGLMMSLQCYADFLQRVDELGFMAISHSNIGLPSLGAETKPEQWHTGDPETDPWQWKDRAAHEKRAAYGSILGGKKGFVAPRLYPAFVAACRPALPLSERYAAGELKQVIWQLWQVFEKHPLLNTSDVRRLMGVSKGSGATPIDSAIVQLEREYYITTAGVRQKVAQNGRPYGWPATVYDRVTHWAPEDWLRAAAALRVHDARQQILDAAKAMGQPVDLDGLERLLF